MTPSCITRIGRSNDGRAFVIYLSDGTKITVGRNSTTKGPAWLKVSQQAIIKTMNAKCRICGGTGKIWNMPDEKHEVCWLCKGQPTRQTKRALGQPTRQTKRAFGQPTT